MIPALFKFKILALRRIYDTKKHLRVMSGCMGQLKRLATPFFGGMAFGSCMVVSPAYVVTVCIQSSSRRAHVAVQFVVKEIFYRRFDNRETLLYRI